MSKKHHSPAGRASTADLKARIERTRREGRFQQALELVKQLNKIEPGPANHDLLKDTYFQRAVQLRSQGYSRDAAAVLEVARRLDEKNPAWLEKIAAEMTLCGDVARARQMLALVPGASNSPVLMGRLADAAILQDKSGRASLPPELQMEYDCIVQAFKQQEAGQDEQAKTTLQGIGLKSPFLEWKLLLRGLQAYYQKDDERARENWQRLDPQRIPARLAAPMRAAIDPGYREAQPPATQQALQKQFEWLAGPSGGSQIRSLREAMATGESLAHAFRLAENLLPAMRQQAPHLIPRLAQCMYWAIHRTGPDELPRYKRVFGAPPDDPHFHRLQALAFDEGGNLEAAHRYWQQYEREIALHPEAWPGDQAKLARALIWLRMGNNAATLPSEEQRKKLPRFLREMQGLPDKLTPAAEACFEKAMELAPNLLEAHAGLFRYLDRQGKTEKAVKAGRRLIELFPDHLATLEELAELYGRDGEHGRELELLQQALKHNPLDRDLRGRLSEAHLNCARQQAEKKQFDKARPHYENALGYAEPNRHGFVACCRAACELKAGEETRAEEFLAQARAKAPGEMLLTYTLLVEAVRLKLPPALKTRFTQEFNAAVSDKPTPALAVSLMEYLHQLQVAGVTYYGQKTHTKKLFEFVDRLDKKECGEDAYIALLGHLARLDTPVRMMGRFFDYAKRKYGDNPFVPYLEAVHLMGDVEEAEEAPRPPMEALWLLDRAEKLAAPRANEPAVKAMLDDIASRRKLLQAFRALQGGPLGMFGRFGNFPFPPGFEEIFDELGIDPEDLF